MSVYVPESYTNILYNVENTQKGIKLVKDMFQTNRQYKMPCSRTTLVSSDNVIKRCRYIDIILTKSARLSNKNSAVMTVDLLFCQSTYSGINND